MPLRDQRCLCEVSLNPRAIPPEDLPLIVFSDLTSGLIEALIKWRTKGSYNHVMWAHSSGKFASQGNTYSEVDVSRYLRQNGRLKYVRIIGVSVTKMRLIQASINRKLDEPWYKKMYDWLGIFGQTIGLKFINTPGLQYCSEDVPHHLKYMGQFLNDDDPIKVAINGIPKHTSPADLNRYLKKFPEHFQVYGRWDSDG